MSIYELYEVDADLESNGVWIDTISTPEKFLLASADNPRFNEKLAILYRPKANLIRQAQKLGERGKEVPKDIRNFISDCELQAFCECVLLDWKNVMDKDGKAIPYSSKNAYKLLSNPNLRKLKEALYAEAEKQSNFIREVEEDSEKNLKKTSTGI